MWVDLLKHHLELIIETLVEKPTIVILVCLLITNGIFINQWINARNNCQDEINAANSLAFDRLIQLYELQRAREEDNKTIDSLIRSKLEEPIKNLKYNVENTK